MRAKLQLLLSTLGLVVNLGAQPPASNHFDGKTWGRGETYQTGF